MRLVIKACGIIMTFSGDTKYHYDCSKLACLIFILFMYKGESPLNIDIPNGTNNGIFIWCQNKPVPHHLSARFEFLLNLNYQGTTNHSTKYTYKYQMGTLSQRIL